MDDVHVHYNSSKSAQMQALAYTQGTDIHVGPRQERHLAHEAWHVVQQMQGRVKPTMQAKNMPINDDQGLEREADLMGRKAENIGQRSIAYQLTHMVQQVSAVEGQNKIGHNPSNIEPLADFSVVSAPLIESVNVQRVIQRVANFQQFVNTKVPALHANYQEAHSIAVLLDYNEYQRRVTIEGQDLYQDLTTAVNWLRANAAGTAPPDAPSHQLMQRLNTLMNAATPGAYSDIRWGLATLWGAGTEVRAILHRGGHAEGSDAGGDPYWMLNLQQRVDRHGTSLYVRGHLLNRHLGGPGLDYNMVPLTQSGDWGANDANGAHSSSIEETVKRMEAKLETGLADQVTNLAYHVKAVYPRPQRTQTIQIAMLLTQLKTIVNEFQKKVSELKDVGMVNIETQNDVDIQQLWNRIFGIPHFPTPNGLYERNATIEALRTGLSRADLNTQIMKLPMGQGEIGTWLLNQLTANTTLASVLRAVSPNHNYQSTSLNNLNHLMRENAALWDAEDKLVPLRLELDASWDQFGNHEAVDDTVKIRLPSSLNADMKLRE